MLGTVAEPDLKSHIQELSEDVGLVGIDVDVQPSGDNFLRLTVSLPLEQNTAAPLVIGGECEANKSFLVYRP